MTPEGSSPSEVTDDTATVGVAEVDERLLDAIRILQELAGQVATDAVVVPGRDVDPAAVGTMLRAVRGAGSYAVALGAEAPGGPGVGPRARLQAADPELTHLAQVLHAIAREDPERQALSRTSRSRQGETPSPIAASSAGVQALAEVAPQQHDEFVHRFRDVLQASLEQRAYRVSREVSRPLRLMAQDLAALQADPRDVVRVQSDAVDQLVGTSADSRLLEAAQDEATLLLIEVLGYLARAYRDARPAAS